MELLKSTVMIHVLVLSFFINPELLTWQMLLLHGHMVEQHCPISDPVD